MSNGGEETFEVIDPGFHERFHGIPAGYQMEVRQLGIPEARSAIQNITYNVTGQNARINQNSVDQSINIIELSSDMAENIRALRDEVNRIVKDELARKVVEAEAGVGPRQLVDVERLIAVFVLWNRPILSFLNPKEALLENPCLERSGTIFPDTSGILPVDAIRENFCSSSQKVVVSVRGSDQGKLLNTKDKLH